MHDPELKKKKSYALSIFYQTSINKHMLAMGLSNIMPPSMKYSEAYAVSCNSIQSEKIHIFYCFLFLIF